MVYGYIRVSTDKQTVENQRFEVSKFCKRNGVSINKWIEETISGTQETCKRKLGSLLEIMQKGDIIICSELSRLGRNRADTHIPAHQRSSCPQKGRRFRLRQAKRGKIKEVQIHRQKLSH